MIMLETDCDTCRHVEVCKYKNNAKNAMEKLKKLNYGNGYRWDMNMNTDNVVVNY